MNCFQQFLPLVTELAAYTSCIFSIFPLFVHCSVYLEICLSLFIRMKQEVQQLSLKRMLQLFKIHFLQLFKIDFAPGDCLQGPVLPSLQKVTAFLLSIHYTRDLPSVTSTVTEEYPCRVDLSHYTTVSSSSKDSSRVLVRVIACICTAQVICLLE